MNLPAKRYNLTSFSMFFPNILINTTKNVFKDPSPLIGLDIAIDYIQKVAGFTSLPDVLGLSLVNRWFIMPIAPPSIHTHKISNFLYSLCVYSVMRERGHM